MKLSLTQQWMLEDIASGKCFRVRTGPRSGGRAATLLSLIRHGFATADKSSTAVWSGRYGGGSLIDVDLYTNIELTEHGWAACAVLSLGGDAV